MNTMVRITEAEIPLSYTQIASQLAGARGYKPSAERGLL